MKEIKIILAFMLLLLGSYAVAGTMKVNFMYDSGILGWKYIDYKESKYVDNLGRTHVCFMTDLPVTMFHQNYYYMTSIPNYVTETVYKGDYTGYTFLVDTTKGFNYFEITYLTYDAPYYWMDILVTINKPKVESILSKYGLQNITYDTIHTTIIHNHYDTLTVHQTIYDHVNVYDTVKRYVTINRYDTIHRIVNDTLYTTLINHVNVYDTTKVIHRDTLITIQNIIHTDTVIKKIYQVIYDHIYDTIFTKEVLYIRHDTLIYSYISVEDTLVIKTKDKTNYPIVKNIRIQVYPNPTIDYINIESSDVFILTAKLYNINGVLVSQTNIVDKKGSLNVEGLNKGTYVLQILCKDLNTITKSIVKK